MSVYIDPHIKKRDGSDARFAFIYEDMPRREFEKKYPNVKLPATSPSGNQMWITKDVVRLATYFEKETRKEWLYSISNDDGSTKFMRESEITIEERKLFNEIIRQGGEGIDRRRIDKHVIRKYLIGGQEILEKGIWPGSYIPVARQVGEEVIIEQTLRPQALDEYGACMGAVRERSKVQGRHDRQRDRRRLLRGPRRRDHDPARTVGVWQVYAAADAQPDE